MKPFLICLLLTLSACSSFHGYDVALEAGADITIGTDAGETDSGTSDADAGCTVMHMAGDAGWTDCVPLGTHTQDQAMKACVAWASFYGYTCGIGTPCPAQGALVYAQTGSPRAWALTGVVYQQSGGTCYADGSWQ